MKTSRQMLDEAWADAMAANAARFPGRTVTLSQYGLLDETLAAYEDEMIESLFDSRPLLWTLDGIHYTRDKS